MAISCICPSCGSPHEPKSDRKPMSKPGKGKDNPFATRGRDKFSELVAKVEEKKQRILQRSGSDNNGTMVRFVHSDDNKLKPVIVRAKSDIGVKRATKVAAVVEEEQTPKKKSTADKLKYNYYLAATVIIITMLLLVLFRIRWDMGGAIDNAAIAASKLRISDDCNSDKINDS